MLRVTTDEETVIFSEDWNEMWKTVLDRLRGIILVVDTFRSRRCSEVFVSRLSIREVLSCDSLNKHVCALHL